MFSLRYFSADRRRLTLFVVVIAIIASAIETDIFVPSFPAVQHYFAATESQVQMILSVNFAALCLSCLFYGPMADAWGRKWVLTGGLALSALGSFGCLIAPNLNTLLAFRFIQGLGSSAAFVVPGALFYDLYRKEEAVKLSGICNSAVTLAMAGTPMLGVFLNIHFGWRANFLAVSGVATLALILVICFVQESLPLSQRIALNRAHIVAGYTKLLTSFPTLACLLIFGLLCSNYFMFIANLSLIFVNFLHVSAFVLGFYQGAVLLTFACTSVFSGKILQYLQAERMRQLGAILCFIGAGLLALVAVYEPNSPTAIIAAMCVEACGFPLLVNVMFGDYMHYFPEIKGLASAMSNGTRFVLSAGIVQLSGMLFTGTIQPVALIIFITTSISLVLFMILMRQKVFSNATTVEVAAH